MLFTRLNVRQKKLPSVLHRTNQTSLETCTKVHKDNWKLDHDKWSAVSDHRLVYDHEFDWDRIKILDVERNWYKRNISGMLHIETNKTIKKQTDPKRLNNIYKTILKNFC